MFFDVGAVDFVLQPKARASEILSGKNRIMMFSSSSPSVD